MSQPTLLFYCQHSLGMGHLVRSFALIRELTSSFKVVFLNGGRLPPGLPVPSKIQLIQLPPLGMNDEKGLVSLDEELTLAEAQAKREALILTTWARLKPQAIVIELFPFGRKKFRNELVALLDQATSSHDEKPVIICSLRDILIGGRRDQQRHDDRAVDLLERYFDAVLVHADPAFARIEESFKPGKKCTTPIYYTGFVLPQQKSGWIPTDRDASVLVSAGGGIVGGPLFRAAVRAQRILWPVSGLPMTIVAGPFLPEPEWRVLQGAVADTPGLTVLRSVPNLGATMRKLRWSVSQCGYNTAMDVLSSKVVALFVPFADRQENEQANRAARLANCGATRTLSPAGLGGQSLAREIQQLMQFEPQQCCFELGGAANTAGIISRLVAGQPDSGLVHAVGGHA